MNLILIAVISLGAIGLVSAIVLYVASKKFAVYEDPRIGQVVSVLPGANCGGCGFPGCNGFASACVKAGSLEGKLCPVGGQPTMVKIAAILGLEAAASEPKVAVVRCNGTCENRPRLTEYDGVRSCVIANSTYGGETGCTFGCLGCGDCVKACTFDAIHMNPETGLPEVDDAKCVACGACSKACPRKIIEIRPKGKNNRRVYVQCVNKEKGAVARKACAVACIGCGKCVKTCPFEAITLDSNLAYIDPSKCKSCRKCEAECPQKAIIAVNFPPRKPKPEGAAAGAGAAGAAARPARPRPAAAAPADVAAPAPAAEGATAAPRPRPVRPRPAAAAASADGAAPAPVAEGATAAPRPRPVRPRPAAAAAPAEGATTAPVAEKPVAAEKPAVTEKPVVEKPVVAPEKPAVEAPAAEKPAEAPQTEAPKTEA